MVPTFTCGFERSNFPAIQVYSLSVLAYRQNWKPRRKYPETTILKHALSILDETEKQVKGHTGLMIICPDSFLLLQFAP